MITTFHINSTNHKNVEFYTKIAEYYQKYQEKWKMCNDTKGNLTTQDKIQSSDRHDAFVCYMCFWLLMVRLLSLEAQYKLWKF